MRIHAQTNVFDKLTYSNSSAIDSNNNSKSLSLPVTEMAVPHCLNLYMMFSMRIFAFIFAP